MSIIKRLNESIKSWDKMESASSIYFMYGWGKKEQSKESEEKHESEDDDYRDDTQGRRNAKHLTKARMYANTPKARIKKQRTEIKKDLQG